MAYTGTKGQTGKGTALTINTGSVSTPTWTPIYEISDVTFSSYENKVDDATNLNSSAVERVFTIQDGGMLEITGNRVSTDPGQVALTAAFASGVATMFELTLPKETGQASTGDMYAFTAIVTKLNPAIKVDKMTKFAGTLATTNGLVYTEGT